MLVGPAALGVALLLLPGWVYWRLEGSPRTARSALGELFEVIGAGSVATGATVLMYVTVAELARAHRLGDFLIQPNDLTPAYVRENFTQACWHVALLVAVACALALAAAKFQRWLRKSDRTTYKPETPLWVLSLGSTDALVTADLKDGRRITGYLGGHSVEDGTPAIFLTPPLQVSSEARKSSWVWREPSEHRHEETFSSHAVTVSGDEIVSVWREYDDAEAAKAQAPAGRRRRARSRRLRG